MSIKPLFIDNYAFAKNHERLSGTLTLADCSRLSAFLKERIINDSQGESDIKSSEATIQASIHYTLVGETNTVGQHFLHLIITADLTVLCQRCIEPMPLKLNLNFSYLISHSRLENQELNSIEESDDFDLQEATESMDVIVLIEDEIMMAMPIAPTHEADCSKVKMQSGEKPNPFAALKGFIKS